MIGGGTGNDDALRTLLGAAVDGLGLADTAVERPMRPLAKRARRGAPVVEEPLARVSLVRIDGVLEWSYEPPPRVGTRRRAAHRAARMMQAEQIDSFPVREVKSTMVRGALDALDRALTPERGLRRLVKGALVPAASPSSGVTPAANERTLLLIHGTFSKGDMFLEELQSTAHGRAFLTWAATQYDQVLTFDHPTVAVSPMINALDLEQAMGGYTGHVDVVCHSRGGLVTAWWLRTAARHVDRVVFVASTLSGTSLAEPERLADAINGFANIADVAARAATLAGTIAPAAKAYLGAGAGLMRALGAILHAGARAPLAGVVGLVPGLAAQAPLDHNEELARLHAGSWATSPKCYAVLSNFEPGGPDAAWWEFWKRWRRPALAVADTVADAIFPDDNDLVVDTKSMVRIRGNDLPKPNRKDFLTNDTVHHINYFVQKDTLAFLRKVLA